MSEINEKDLEQAAGGRDGNPLHQLLRPTLRSDPGKLIADGYIRHEGDCVCPVNKFKGLSGYESGCCRDCVYAYLSSADSTGYYCKE